jgi:hypothetical protein
MPAATDLTGQRFGRLTVIARSGSRGGRASWLCRCDCGNSVIETQNVLAMGRAKSCGCLNDELRAKRSKKAGDARGKQLTRHGHSKERLYTIWKSMRQRCMNKRSKDYQEYGGRGIDVCDEWNDYEAFRGWAMSHGYDQDAAFGVTTIDRINVDGNYEPSNCRFVDLETQANNRRKRRS